MFRIAAWFHLPSFLKNLMRYEAAIKNAISADPVTNKSAGLSGDPRIWYRQVNFSESQNPALFKTQTIATFFQDAKERNLKYR